MKLFAAYVEGGLLDQVSGESEDTAFAKLKMKYTELPPKGVKLELVDPDYTEPKKEEVVNTVSVKPLDPPSDKKVEEVKEEEVVLKEAEEPKEIPTDTEKKKKPFVVIEAGSIEIIINVKEGEGVSVDQLTALNEAVEEGTLMLKKGANA